MCIITSQHPIVISKMFHEIIKSETTTGIFQYTVIQYWKHQGIALCLVNLALNHFAHVYTIAKFHVVY